MSTALTGLELIERERARQHQDALSTLDQPDNQALAARIANSARQAGQLLLLGMGASHHANLVATAIFRQLGVETFALPLSEALYAPLPARARTVILTSQSGGSVEAERYLEQPQAHEDRYGMTLNPESALAGSVPSLVAAGGSEQGFAATRSYLLTLALHATIAEALGAPQDDLRGVLHAPPEPDVRQAAQQLASATHFIFSARGALQGIAEVGALGILELARLPAFALEGGQFRHGPLEALRPDTGVVLFRSDAHASLVDSNVRACQEAGLQPTVFDASSDASRTSGWISVGPHAGLAVAAALCEPLQRFLLLIAAQHVERVGEPLRSSKVTRHE